MNTHKKIMWGVRECLVQALLAAQLYPRFFSVIRKVMIYTAVFLSPWSPERQFLSSYFLMPQKANTTWDQSSYEQQNLCFSLF